MRNQSCSNCDYFSPYYLIIKTRLVYASAGICKQRKLTAKEKRMIPVIFDCPEWKSRENHLEEHKANLTKVLCEMTERLHQIAEILKIDI